MFGFVFYLEKLVALLLSIVFRATLKRILLKQIRKNTKHTNNSKKKKNKQTTNINKTKQTKQLT